MKKRMMILAAVASSAPASAIAQTDAPFTGSYVGAEAGGIEHHIYLETETAGASEGRYHRKWGAGGGVFAGHDIAVSSGLRFGGEVALTTGGEDNVVAFSNSTELRLTPRYGYRVSVHGGPVIGSALWIYASGGYGGNRYRVRNTASVTGVEDWGGSFLVGAGAEYRLSSRLGLRVDYKHVDNQTHQIFLGVPVRF